MGAYTQPASTIAPNKEKVFELLGFGGHNACIALRRWEG